jgi:drug/metabolite transporter (DMT)-like permease
VGALLIVLSAIGFGAMAIFAKLAYGAGATVPTVLVGRFWLAAALLWAGLALAGQPPRLAPRQALPFLAMGGVGYFGQSLCYFMALQFLDAATTALLLYAYPALVVALAALLRIERPTRAQLAALGLAAVGCLLVLGGPTAPPDPRGVALAVAGATVYSGYILVGSRLGGRAPALVSSAYILVGAAGSFALFGVASGQLDLALGSAGWLAIGAIAIVSTVVPVAAFLAGLGRVGPGRAAILSTAEPLTTVTLAALVLGETLEPVQLGGGALIVLASLLAQRAPRPRPTPLAARRAGARSEREPAG